ncbi:NAD-glutamate dehydrogenase [bacterium]|nr:NAD-glutamate dehydrogenase [bacterium]
MSVPTAVTIRFPPVAGRLREVRRLLSRGGRPGRELLTVAPHFFKNAPDGFVLGYSAGDLASILHSARRVMALSLRTGVGVAVFNPEEKKDGSASPRPQVPASLTPAGFSSDRTVLQISARDGPFYVASVRECLRGLGLNVVHLVHPILPIRVERGGGITPVQIGPGEPGQSLIHVEVDRVEDARRLRQIETSLESIYADIRHVVRDFDRMRAATVAMRSDIEKRSDTDPDARREEAEFLTWLLDGNFILLGYREYNLANKRGRKYFSLRRGSGLGILRAERISRFYRPVPLTRVVPSLRRGLKLQGASLVVAQTSALSPIYRREPMAYIGQKIFDGAGRLAGERRIQGLFTNRVEGLPSTDIPILRKKFEAVIQAEGVQAHSHDFREIYGIFAGYPKDLLFGASVDDLRREIRTALVAQSKLDFKATFRPDLRGRGISVMVVMPKEKFNTDARARMEAVLRRRLEAASIDYSLSMGTEGGDFARLYFFCVTGRKTPAGKSFTELERELAEICKTWPDRLREVLAASAGPRVADRLFKKYGTAFSVEFHNHTPPQGAQHDILMLEKLKDPGDIHVDIFNSKADPDCSRLKLYHLRTKLVLSDIMPVLTHHGFRVVDEMSNSVRPPASAGDLPMAFIHTFRLQSAAGKIDVERLGAILSESIVESLDGRIECDALSSLTLLAGLQLREVLMLRLYRNYLHQIVPAYTLRSIDAALVENPAVARILTDLFIARFDLAFGPPRSVHREKRESDQVDLLEEALNSVDDLLEDRILRLVADAIRATVRTNYFQTPIRQTLGMKIRSADIHAMPRPVPLFEIFVQDSHVEGIHLRGGLIARGGIRLSDRRDDYRTEVLGLMKTQMVKNAVIVPVGAKGGFVIKRGGTPRDAVEGYRRFIRTLLDLTDNMIGGRVIQPVGCVIHDEPDPYLVVAADKGTAKYSDVANDISLSAGFWLGDAFASGGKDGYDHKKLGITARGVWVCLRHHLNMRAHAGSLTCVAIGDMAGDVFGNGMIWGPETRTLKLLAAFNHKFIFLDPNPNARKAWLERRRLFRMPQSNWNDYDTKAISKGGGVSLRSSKRLNLSPEAARLLGVPVHGVSGEDVIRAILKMDVDLLYNGGIGTYVKATEERHPDVGDPINDRVRVNASEVRAKIIGEGGNLGLTQAARIEYARAGGRINTDAVDNSAGVDLSDHEVNLKILLREMRVPAARGRRMLRGLTGPVTARVLEDNESQSRVLSLEERRSLRQIEVYPKLMDALKDRQGMSREIEGLPSDREISERAKKSQSFWRPELAVLLAYVKLAVNRDLLEDVAPKTSLSADPVLGPFLQAYFPRKIVRSFGRRLTGHPLADQIVAAAAANAFVNRAGLTAAFRLAEDCDVSWSRAVRAYFVAERLTGAESIRSAAARTRMSVPESSTQGNARDGISFTQSRGRIETLDELEENLFEITRWILKEYAQQDVTAALETFGHLTRLLPIAESLLSVAERKIFREYHRRIRNLGVPPTAARRLTEIHTAPHLLDLQVAGRRLRKLR